MTSGGWFKERGRVVGSVARRLATGHGWWERGWGEGEDDVGKLAL